MKHIKENNTSEYRIHSMCSTCKSDTHFDIAKHCGRRLRFESRQRGREFSLHLTKDKSSGASIYSYKTQAAKPFPGDKAASGHHIHHLLPSTANFKNARNILSHSHLFMA